MLSWLRLTSMLRHEIFALMLKYVMTTTAASLPSPSGPGASTGQIPPKAPGAALQQPPAQTMSPPSAPPQLTLTYPNCLFPEPLTQLISRLPRALADLALTGTISTQMIHLLTQVSAWAGITSSPNPSATVTQSDVFRLYCEPMETARMALSILLALPPISIEPRLEHLLCIGLCLSIRGARNQARPPALQTRLLSDFITCTRALTSRHAALSQPEQDCLIWISFLAAYGSGHPGFQRQVDGLIDLVVGTYYERVGRNWTGMETLLRRFFWFEPLGEDWKGLWSGSVMRLGR